MSQSDTSISRYLRLIGKRKLLTKEQEIELAQLIEKGQSRTWFEEVEEDGQKKSIKRVHRPSNEDKGNAHRARECMISSNLRLVVSIAKAFQNRGCDLEDLIEEGNIGLIKGVEKFEWRKGFRFSTYASWWIRQSIGRYVANQGRVIKVPGRTGHLQSQLEEARYEFIDTNGQEPTHAELASLMGVTEATVIAALNGIPRVVSLDMPVGENDRQLKDVIPDEESESPFDMIDRDEMVKLVTRVLDTLTPREAKILHMRFGITADPNNSSMFPVTKNEVDRMAMEAKDGIG